MSITTDFNAINENYNQADIALKYQREFKIVYSRLIRLSNEINQVVSSTEFTAIPTDAKQSLNGFWQLVKSFNAAVEADSDVMEMLGQSLSVTP